MPDIQKILNRYSDVNLVVIAVNNGEEAAPARRFLSRLNLKFTAFAFDPKGDIANQYRIEGMPTSVFIDAEGLITRLVSGQITLNVMDSAVRDAILGAGKVETKPPR
jgi:cytochrome c biogenesis protein CcmG/thiol:disulfide interchange protein DsbE